MNTDHLELRQLRCLVAVAEEGSFTDAAIRLGTSQPAVSRAVARLEETVGVRLVERTTRAVALTAAGAALCRAFATALSGIDEAIDTARGTPRPLRLGYSWAAFGRHTTGILRGWRDEHPDVPLEVHRIDERYAGVTTGRSDIAVIRGPVEPDSLVARVLFEERRLAALPAGHRLADRDALEITELQEPIVLTPSVGTTTLELWPEPSRPTATVVVDNIDEWLTVIASGAALGVTVEATSFQHPHPGIVFVPLVGVPPVAVQLAWPAGRAHPAVREFVAHVRRAVLALEG